MSCVALVHVRRSMVRYEQDRASPECQLANCIRLCEDNRGPRDAQCSAARGIGEHPRITRMSGRCLAAVLQPRPEKEPVSLALLALDRTRPSS